MMKNLVKVTPDMYPTGALVYVAQPYGGDSQRYEKAKITVSSFIKRYKDCVFVSPVLQYGHMYEGVEYIEGLEICINLLRKCDRLLLLKGWHESRGCMAEWAAARALGIPIYYNYSDNVGNMWYETCAPVCDLGEDGDEK